MFVQINVIHINADFFFFFTSPPVGSMKHLLLPCWSAFTCLNYLMCNKLLLLFLFLVTQEFDSK